jgi:hypothetical protein
MGICYWNSNLIDLFAVKWLYAGERASADEVTVIYLALITFVASHSPAGGNLRNWLHRSSMMRAG